MAETEKKQSIEAENLPSKFGVGNRAEEMAGLLNFFISMGSFYQYSQSQKCYLIQSLR